MSVKIKQEPIDFSEVNIHSIPSTLMIKSEPDRVEPKVLVENCEGCGSDIPPVLSAYPKKIKSEAISTQNRTRVDLKYPASVECTSRIVAMEKNKNRPTVSARIKVTAPSPPPLSSFGKTDYHNEYQYRNKKPWHKYKWRRPMKRSNFHKSSNFTYKKNFYGDFDSSRKYNLNRSRLYNVPLKYEKKEVILLRIKSTDNVREVLFNPPPPIFRSYESLASKETLTTTKNTATETLPSVNSNTLPNILLKPSTESFEGNKENMDSEPGSSNSMHQIVNNNASEININNENYVVIDKYKDNMDKNKEDNTMTDEYVNMDDHNGKVIGKGNADIVEIQNTVRDVIMQDVTVDHENECTCNDLNNISSVGFEQSNNTNNKELEIISEMPKDEEIICMDRKNKEVHLCTKCFVKGRKEKKGSKDVVFVGIHNKKIRLNRPIPIVSIDEMEEIM